MSKEYIGVDITANAVRVVGIRAGKVPVFLGCKELPIEKGTSVKEGITDAVQIASILKNALRGAVPKPLSIGQAVTAIRENQVFRKVMDMPVVTDLDELSQAIHLQATEFIPQEKGDSEIDFQILGKSEDGLTQQVMMVSVPSSVISQYVQVFSEAKLHLKAIDVRAAALARGTVATDEKAAIILVNIEEDAAVISLYQGGVVRVTSSVPVTSEDEEMEDTERVRQLNTILADEIDHVIKFYSNRTHNHAAIKHVRLASAGTWLHDLKEVLEDNIEVPVIIAKPVLVVPAFCDGRFLVALGCALYAMAEES